jgi:lipoprotein-anchoring transpeptidase ErfK/SrfK
MSELSRDFGRKGAAGLASVALAAAIVCELSTPAAAERPERYQRERYSERYQQERNQRDRRDTQEARRPVVAAPDPEPLQAEGPLLMLVSLNKQRMYVYDSKGLLTQTRVSSGMKGFDTPVGIYSILQKNADHKSNIYESAPMPHMQRLTMTGIALHGGVVPGYPASHGCVRLPFEFAKKFFGMTELNQRVVISPDVQAPVRFDHPMLFTALPPGTMASISDGFSDKTASNESGLTTVAATAEIAPRTLMSVADERVRERVDLVNAAERAKLAIGEAQTNSEAANKVANDKRNELKRAQGSADEARRVAAKAAKSKSSAEGNLASISKRLAGDLSKMKSDKLEALRKSEVEAKDRIPALAAAAEQAAAEVERTRTSLAAAQAAYKEADAARANAKANIKAVVAAEKKAANAIVAFDRAERNRDFPVSVFVSTKTSKIMIRQGFELLLEAPVTIENPDQPLGTFLMSATNWRDSSQTALNWTVAAVTENSLPGQEEPEEVSDKRRKSKEPALTLPPQTDAAEAAATLDRIKIPKEITDKISEVVKPGSTFIVSDYDISRSETRFAGTDFIVQMPEVVAKITRPKPKRDEYYDDDDYGWSFFGGSSYQKRRPARPYGGKFYF